MNEATFRRDLIAELQGIRAELQGIRAALEAANELNPLNIISGVMEAESGAQAGAEGAGEGAPAIVPAVDEAAGWVSSERVVVRQAEGPTDHFPGVLAVYRHPAGEGWRIVARRQAGVPGGWDVSVEGNG